MIETISTETEDPAWQELIRNQISSRTYRYTSPQREEKLEKRQAMIVDKFKTKADEFSQKHPHLPMRMFQDDTFSMPAVAVLATYLEAKKGVTNLFVCKSHEAFQKKLTDIVRYMGNIRVAMVVTDWAEVSKSDDPKDGDYGTDATHKLAVCVEKKGEKIKIAILDPLGTHKSEISPGKALASAESLRYADLGGLDYLLWAICHSGLNLQETTLYYSKVERQNTLFACETFALRDGIAFLKDPNFFDHLETQKLLFKEGKAALTLFKIKSLPPAFMQGAQSVKLLNKYSNGDHDPEELKALNEKVSKHFIEVSGKNQNHTFNQKSMKYMLLVTAALEVLPPEQLQAIVRRTLLTAPRVPLAEDLTIRTLSDIPSCKTEVIIKKEETPFSRLQGD